MATVKIAFAGVGYMGQVAHLRNYVDRADCEVIAIAEPRSQLAQEIAKRYKIPKIYSNHLELAADPEIQAVVVSQPHLRNGHIAIPLLRSGKHVFVEKPMAGSVEEAECIQQAADAQSVKVMIGLMKRHDTAVLAARKELQQIYENGEMGQLRRIRAHCFGGDWIHNTLPPLTTTEAVPEDPLFTPIYPAWMDTEQARQFQSYMNIIAHNINLVRYLYPHPLTVQAAIGRRDQRLLHTALLSGSDGVLVELAGGAVRSHQWEEETHFYFEKGWVKLYTPSPLNQQARGRVEIYRTEDQKSGERREIIPVIDWAFRRQAEHFISCIQNGEEPVSGGRDTLVDMRLMEDVFRTMILV
ncbi:MAG: Gfo/Idh/MocA family protein [Caldilinea sp.]